MPKSVSVSAFARNFAEYLDLVAEGEGFVLTRRGKPVAELRPVSAGRRLSELPEIFASLPRLGADEAEAFGRDVDAAREALNRAGVRSIEDYQ